MTINLGDVVFDRTYFVYFTSRQFATGMPFLLAGTPTAGALVGNSTTPITDGLGITANHGGITGLNRLQFALEPARGFAPQTEVTFVLLTGTVDGVSVAGEVLALLSIENRAGLRPTVAGRSLDVSATGEAGIDWGNVGSPTTTQTLSGTTIGTATAVTTVQGLAANAVNAAAVAADAVAELQAGLATSAALAAVQADTDALQTQIAALPTDAEVADLVWDASLVAHQAVGSTGAALQAAGSAGDPWATPLPGAYGAGSAGQMLGTRLDAQVSTRASGTALSTLQSDVTALDGRVPAALVSGKMDASVSALTTPATTSIADALLTRDLSAVVGEATRSILNALRFLRNRWFVIGSVLTVTKEDDTTTAWTSNLGTTPGADPITSSDPS